MTVVPWMCRNNDCGGCEGVFAVAKQAVPCQLMVATYYGENI